LLGKQININLYLTKDSIPKHQEAFMKRFVTLFLFLSIQFCFAQLASQVTTIATGLGSVRGLDFDSQGNLYVASGSSILKITPNGAKSTFTTESSFIWELKIDSNDNIFYAQNTQIVKLDMQGNKTVIANQSGYWYQGIAFDGKGNVFTSSNTAGQKAHILSPNGNGGYTETPWGGTIQLAGYGIAYDKFGWLYVTNINPGGLVKTNADGTVMIITIGGKAQDCEADSLGNVYVTTQANNVIKKVDPQGNVTIFAGTGTAGTTDGSLTTAQFSSPSFVCVHNGDLYITDNGSQSVRKISNILATDIEDGSEKNLPMRYSLEQNYPNPFNPSATIEYSIPVAGTVSLKVFNVLGKEITTLVNGEMNAGNYSVQFDASRLVSGIYFYQLRSGNFTETKRMLLLK